MIKGLCATVGHFTQIFNAHRGANPRFTLEYVTSSKMMKRKATGSESASKAKRQREPEPDYCDVGSRLDDNGSIIWPAEVEAVKGAREFLKRWFRAQSVKAFNPILTNLLKCCLCWKDFDCTRQRRRWTRCWCHHPQNPHCTGFITVPHRRALDQERRHYPYGRGESSYASEKPKAYHRRGSRKHLSTACSGLSRCAVFDHRSPPE